MLMARTCHLNFAFQDLEGKAKSYCPDSSKFLVEGAFEKSVTENYFCACKMSEDTVQ